ncbi:Tad domain-containing protein [Humibacillus xanthopallidus]|uniref:Tad domain-containing protein n=1 Tax=Humibacillus xanthopallidus TaxID=412689 RepID=UPI00384CD34D
MLLATVVMGMLALTVDVGSIMVERRSLQNGADAASMALADVCAQDEASCDPNDGENDAMLTSLLEANTGSDGLSQLELDGNRPDTTNGQCARTPTGSSFPGMPECLSASETADIAALNECPPVPAWLADEPEIPYVETYSRTLSEGGTSILPKYFAQTLVGTPPDSSVSACARAAWGAPTSYTGTIPITFSVCEWQYFMDDYGGYVAELPGPNGYGSGPGQTPWPTTDREKVIYLKASSSAEPKTCFYNGMNDFPGAFGFVTSTGCVATVTTEGWVDTKTGTAVPNDCKPLLSGMHNTVVALPVFDCVQGGASAPTADIATLDCTDLGTGTQAWYHIAGWAKFYISAVRAPSVNLLSGISGEACSNSEVCLKGWFVKGSLEDVDSITAPDGDNDFGTYAVLPAG